MVTAEFDHAAKVLTAEELRRLPADQRDAILAAAAERAETDYLHDSQLTDFEGFGPEDLHGESVSQQRCDTLRGREGFSDSDPGVEHRSTPG